MRSTETMLHPTSTAKQGGFSLRVNSTLHAREASAAPRLPFNSETCCDRRIRVPSARNGRRIGRRTIPNYCRSAAATCALAILLDLSPELDQAVKSTQSNRSIVQADRLSGIWLGSPASFFANHHPGLGSGPGRLMTRRRSSQTHECPTRALLYSQPRLVGRVLESESKKTAAFDA
jgi:hypothetical protein